MRGARLLAQAEVVLHDALTDPALRELAPQARWIDVGKRGFCDSVAQTSINALLVRHGRADRRVVRLKGGDPSVFGRLEEELEALLAAGIDCEVVPGVTAAIAAAAATRRPLTRPAARHPHRRHRGHLHGRQAARRARAPARAGGLAGRHAGQRGVARRLARPDPQRPPRRDPGRCRAAARGPAHRGHGRCRCPPATTRPPSRPSRRRPGPPARRPPRAPETLKIRRFAPIRCRPRRVPP
ncbi:SAM-dependent methyltransferase [Piscinibacter sakaiensis]|uniref:SAM-dependent methyltransferase n=1 Tax=Piscinibacter sakaiensis TaxID=1547922 RepID=UPI00372D0A9C